MTLNVTFKLRKATIVNPNRLSIEADIWRPGHSYFKGDYIGSDIITEDYLSEKEKQALKRELEKRYGYSDFDPDVVSIKQRESIEL